MTVRKADCCGNCAKTSDAYGKLYGHVYCAITEDIQHMIDVCDEFKEIENK